MHAPSRLLAFALDLVAAHVEPETFLLVLHSAIGKGGNDKEKIRAAVIEGIRSIGSDLSDTSKPIGEVETIGAIIALMALFTVDHSEFHTMPTTGKHTDPSTN